MIVDVALLSVRYACEYHVHLWMSDDACGCLAMIVVVWQ